MKSPSPRCRPQFKPAALLMLLLPLAQGCGLASGQERYTPRSDTAQQALDAALAAWKAGEPVGPVTLKDPYVRVEVADATRRPGQRLVDYEIRGEISAEGPRSFAVRLLMDEPREDRDVRYYVVGIDPLWVFRQADYDLVAHWEACADESAEEQIGKPSR